MGLGKIVMKDMGKSIRKYWNNLEGSKKRDIASVVITVGSLATGIGSPFIPIVGGTYLGIRNRKSLGRLYENIKDKIGDIVDNQKYKIK